MADGKFVAYYRVSTDRQGQSSLGLDAQRDAVLRWLNGNQGEIVREFVEVESGKKKDRPELLEALQLCKKRKATLIIAKLDRLARNVHFISGLMDSGTEFVAADNPHTNKLMIHMLAVFAEHERELISKRTREALAAAKIRGVKLGMYGAEKLSKENKAMAEAFAESMQPVANFHYSNGAKTCRAMAQAFNVANVPTFYNRGRWHASTVRKLVERSRHLDLE